MHRWAMGILVAVAALLVAASAGGRAGRSAGEITWKDPAGDVRAGGGLTRAERDAIDIVSVRVAGQEGLGLFATVTFRGNFQKAIGRGHLTKTIVGIVLRPKIASEAVPAVLLTAGPGAGKIYRKTRSEQVGAARNGRILELAIVGPGFDSVGSVDVKVLTTGLQLPTHQPPLSVLQLDPSIAASFASARGADASHGLPQYGSLTCPQLAELIRDPHAKALYGAGLEGLENEYAERCGTQTTGAYTFDFGDPPLCFVDNGSSTDVKFAAMGLHGPKPITIVPALTFPRAFPPATGTLRLSSTSGFDQTKALTFDATGRASATTFTLTSFGDYTAQATANVAGQTVQASTTFNLNRANDKTTC